MQVHGPSQTFEQPSARLNTTNPTDPFITVDHGSMRVNAETVAECDAMIAAWTEAKRLLIEADAAAGLDHAIAADLDEQTAPECPAIAPRPIGHLVCTKAAGHDGPHEARGSGFPDDDPSLNWQTPGEQTGGEK